MVCNHLCRKVKEDQEDVKGISYDKNGYVFCRKQYLLIKRTHFGCKIKKLNGY